MEKPIYDAPKAMEIYVHLRRVVCQSLTGDDLNEYGAETINGGDDF